MVQNREHIYIPKHAFLEAPPHVIDSPEASQS